MSDSRVSNGGIGFFGALALVFIVLKLTHYVDWSWVMVLSPIWAPAIVIVVLLGLIFVFAYASGEIGRPRKR